jgi:hypothetical protein
MAATTKSELESYVNKVGVQQIFQELLEDVVTTRPDDPIDYLVGLLTEKDERSSEEKKKMLKEVWETATNLAKKKRVKDVLRELRSPTGLLTLNFPNHKRQVMCCLITVSGDNIADYDSFVSDSMDILDGAGGPNGRDSSLLSS